MPTIQSKKYPTDEHTQFVSAGEWEIMKKKGLARRYTVIDDGDLQETVIPAPQAITDFKQSMTDLETPIEVEKIELPERDYIKDELDKLGVEYNTRATTESLYKKLKENE